MTIEEILNNPLWQPLLAGLAILTMVTMIVIFLLSRKKKKLSYNIISNNGVLLKKEEVDSKLQIFFEGINVNDVYLSIIRLINTGNVEIKPEDIHERIKINFGDNSIVLTSEISNGLDVIINKEKNKVILERTLINQNDFIEIKTLVNNFSDKNKIKIEGRISGINKITEYAESPISTLILFIGVVFFIIFALAGVKDINYEYGKFYLLIAFLSYFVSAIAVLSMKKSRKRFLEMFTMIMRSIAK